MYWEHYQRVTKVWRRQLCPVTSSNKIFWFNYLINNNTIHYIYITHTKIRNLIRNSNKKSITNDNKFWIKFVTLYKNTKCINERNTIESYILKSLHSRNFCSSQLFSPRIAVYYKLYGGQEGSEVAFHFLLFLKEEKVSYQKLFYRNEKYCSYLPN